MSDVKVVKRTRKPAAAKKDKKPIQVVAVVTPDGIEGSFTPEPRRPLIVHLPFNSSDISDTGTFVPMGSQRGYNPLPQPFDMEGQIYFQVNTETSSNEQQVGVEQEGWKMEAKVETVPTETVPTALPIDLDTTRSQLLACYASKPGETWNIPEKTDVACFWCTSKFEGPPCFLPVKEESQTYHVYGNFCSPQCGLSFLLQEHIDSHVRWDRMSLLHRMYRPLGKTGTRLYPAPPRECLAQYGGPYTIEQYRNIIRENRVRIDLQNPPMVSILGTLDTKPIDFYDSSLQQNAFTGGFSMDRFKSWSEQGGALRLKRSKPLKDKESTLDACFQISVRNTPL